MTINNKVTHSHFTFHSFLFIFYSFLIEEQRKVRECSKEGIKKEVANPRFTTSERRERDSNPRYLAVQRFSRPPQSTTLPSLQTSFSRALVFKSDAKVRLFFESASVSLENFKIIFYFCINKRNKNMKFKHLLILFFLIPSFAIQAQRRSEMLEKQLEAVKINPNNH